ncbi:hypothetical protein JOB18_031890 [Solea senegalensis]|uniref:Uncharacterized protein n=1 Tax=Solea senegalensis TaxID=28829 RepID=A0AAV6RMB9_SOLSE|nr:hypothetical protein JOB18_031890 [Solea senegalensis]
MNYQLKSSTIIQPGTLQFVCFQVIPFTAVTKYDQDQEPGPGPGPGGGRGADGTALTNTAEALVVEDDCLWKDLAALLVELVWPFTNTTNSSDGIVSKRT